MEYNFLIFRNSFKQYQLAVSSRLIFPIITGSSSMMDKDCIITFVHCV